MTLDKPLVCDAAWYGSEVVGRDDWTFTLSPALYPEIDAALDAVKARGLAAESIVRGDFPLPRLGPVLASILPDLEGGRGFARLTGVPVDRYGADDLRRVFWGLGTHLGWAEVQDGEGRRLHDVRDIGRRFGADDKIRYFQTSQAIDFHNDGADIFVLLCVRAGREGGRSRLVSAVTVFNEIVARRPDLARVLQQDFHVDARGQRDDGARCQVLPVFSWYEGHLNVLHKRAYIESAQRFEDVPRLTAEQVEALDLLDEVMGGDGVALEFDLAPGDALVASNHVTLHGRTAFRDDGAADGGRHMLRLWLTIPHGRPLPPHYADTREFAATCARRVAVAA